MSSDLLDETKKAMILSVYRTLTYEQKILHRYDGFSSEEELEEDLLERMKYGDGDIEDILHGIKHYATPSTPENKPFLDEVTRQKLKKILEVRLYEGMFEDGGAKDIFYQGITWKGFDNFTDQDILDELSNVSEDEEVYDLYQEALAQKATMECLVTVK